jgi:MazG family protein
MPTKRKTHASNALPPRKNNSPKKAQRPAIHELLDVMARLRAPDGCPWDLEQTHHSIIYHAVEEIYELMDAIEAGDDREMAEELGDLLLQVVFHSQMAKERGAFDFNQVAQNLVDKLIRRHPHVFGESKVRSISGIWEQWDKIKKNEKAGTQHERKSSLDGIPRHLPALMKAEKLFKKARKAGLLDNCEGNKKAIFPAIPATCGKTAASTAKPSQYAALLFELVGWAQQKGWSPEALLRAEIQKREKEFRRKEKNIKNHPK